MIHTILEILSSFILFVIDVSGYAGVFILMALESAAIPIPSEIIMTFSGFLAFRNDFSFFAVVLTGSFGNLFGSLLLYAVGYYGGRRVVMRYGRYIFFSEYHLRMAEQWFTKYGAITAFLGRILPIIRTYVSFPAGLARMNIWKFSAYTFIGSFIWSFFLAWIGFTLGERWQNIETYARKFDIVIAGIIILGMIYFIWSHLKKRNTMPR